MNLTQQIHVYSLDTACFYNEREMVIYYKMLRVYKLINNVKDKKDKLYKTKQWKKRKIINNQHKRLNKIIKVFKEQLTQEFHNTRQYNQEHGTIRKLRPETLIERNVVSIFESFLTRTLHCVTNQLTKDIMIIKVFFYEVAEDLIKQGFYYQGDKYVLFSASAGQIRTKKFVVIKESVLKQYEKTLMCGLTIDEINKQGGVNVNKFLAYYALTNSATEEWIDFDIDKSIVVEDFETVVKSKVDFIDDLDYNITRKEMDVPIPHTDGCGMVLNDKTTMIRLPWVKGLMVQFDFRKFIRHHWTNINNNCGLVKDIYGQEHDVLAEDIQYIFTKSQFKMWKYYSSWNEYKQYYKQYRCTAGRINEEERYINDAHINYQMLQSLSDMTEKEMRQLASATVADIEKIGTDFQTTMRLLGANEYNNHPNYMQRILMVYPELVQDKFNKQVLKDTRNSLIKHGRAGRLRVNGKYTFVAPDMYAFCEWLFLGDENPQGLLKDGEVSCRLYSDGVELDCLRSPHLYREHAVRKNRTTDTTQEWFQTKCIYTSCHDTISKILQFDCDGDKLLVVQEPLLIDIAKRHMDDIVPLYYDMKKAQPTQLTPDNLFEGLRLAFTGGNIGIYSNNISKVYNSGTVNQQALNVIKWLCMENNFVIDYAKTLYKPTRPKEVDEIIKGYTGLSLPYFFYYAKDKTDEQIQPYADTPVNYLEKIIESPPFRVKMKCEPFDYRVLMCNPEFELNITYSSIIETYDYYNSYKWRIFNNDTFQQYTTHDQYVYTKIKEKLLSLPFSKDEVIDTLIYFLFTERKSSLKKTFWECFGEEVYQNVLKNVDSNTTICPICGKRIQQSVRGRKKIYCSVNCRQIAQYQSSKNTSFSYEIKRL